MKKRIYVLIAVLCLSLVSITSCSTKNGKYNNSATDENAGKAGTNNNKGNNVGKDINNAADDVKKGIDNAAGDIKNDMNKATNNANNNGTNGSTTPTTSPTTTPGTMK